jgi:hypothetical protein
MKFLDTAETVQAAIVGARGAHDVYMEDDDGSLVLAGAQPSMTWASSLDGKCVFSVSQTDPDTQCIIAYHKHTSETAYLDTLELLSRSDGNSTHRTHKQHIFKNLS